METMTNYLETEADGLLRVCRIGRAQGLKGEVNIQVFTDSPVLRFQPGSILLDNQGKSWTVERSRTFKNRWIIKLEGVDDRNASEELKGMILYVPAPQISADKAKSSADSDVPPVPPDAAPAQDEQTGEEGWYPQELIGLEVLAVDDHESALAADYDGVDAHVIGHVSEVDLNNPQPLITVKLVDAGGKEALIPFVEALVPIVDPDEGYILVDPPGGLLDLT